MRLLFYIYTLLPGGAERVMTILCNELVDRGYDVYLATNTELPFAYSLDPRVKTIHLIPKRGTFHNFFTRYFNLQRNIRHIAKQVKPDVITSFNYILNVHVIIATLGLKIPVISSEHNTFDKHHLFYEYIIRFWLNRLAANTVILTQYDYKYLGKRLPRKIVISNPLSFPISTEKKAIRKKNILAVGSIDRWKHKGFDNLVKIWSKIESQYPEWILEIAGGGDEKSFSYIKSLAKKYGALNRIRFLGVQRNIDKVMLTSSIFILTSRYEGFPMVLGEAMSQGCACISFDCTTGPGEILTHNRNGLLIKNQDIDEMVSNLKILMSDSGLRDKLSNNAKKDIEYLLPKHVINKWISMFNEVVRT